MKRYLLIALAAAALSCGGAQEQGEPAPARAGGSGPAGPGGDSAGGRDRGGQPSALHCHSSLSFVRGTRTTTSWYAPRDPDHACRHEPFRWSLSALTVPESALNSA